MKNNLSLSSTTLINKLKEVVASLEKENKNPLSSMTFGQFVRKIINNNKINDHGVDVSIIIII